VATILHMYCVHPAKDIAPIDAVKGVNIFKKVDVPVCPPPPVSSRYMVCTQFTGADTRNGPKYECIYLHTDCQHTIHIFRTEGVACEC
jgi:hypothetical protein